ncbi:unnamed protein product [Mytilus edulis]|uniref:Uncharacterized protein n=1 Tax=Mytilus edulis TaxID=6550 RepID=A0A8S3UW42_MYTED|nr:unnamed protein product [Mytilus edulis]
MKPQKRNRQPPNSLRSGAEKKATSKRKRPNVSKSHVHSDPERLMAPRGNQNIIAAGSHSTQVMVNESGDEIIASNQNHSDRAELDPVIVAIPGPSSSRVPMSSTESLRRESHDIATTIHRRAADNDSSIVSQVEMVPSIQDSHGNSPIKVCEVEKYLLEYPEITAAAELIHGLRFGFKLMYAGPRFSFTCKNSKSVLKNTETTRKKLNKEIELGTPSSLGHGNMAARSIKRRTGGQNLGLQSKGYNFHWYGQRGMKWKNLLPSDEENLRCYPPPQILIIHLGSNDLGLIKGKRAY